MENEMKIKLGGQEFEVEALPYGKLKKAIRLMNAATNLQEFTDEVMDSVGQLFAVMLDKSTDEIDAMPITFDEIVTAMPAIADVCGLTRVQASGEVKA